MTAKRTAEEIIEYCLRHGYTEVMVDETVSTDDIAKFKQANLNVHYGDGDSDLMPTFDVQ